MDGFEFLCRHFNFKLKSSSHRWIYLLFKPIPLKYMYNKLETFTAYTCIFRLEVYHMNMLHMLPWPVYNRGKKSENTYCSMTGDLYLVSARRKINTFRSFRLSYVLFFMTKKGRTEVIRFTSYALMVHLPPLPIILDHFNSTSNCRTLVSSLLGVVVITHV